MKTRLISFCICILCLISCSDRKTRSWQSREMHLANLQEQFAKPGKEYRPAPLWVWNTAMTEADIDRMLRDFKDEGFGGAFVHPRPGLETEYLSEEWFRLWRYSVEKGKELGLDIWIYDENSYPSGFAGGHVPAEMPESYNQGQALIGELTTTLPEKTDDIFLCIEKTGDDFIDISGELAAHKGKESTYYIYRMGYNQASSWTAGFPYVDLTAPGVTEKFIEVTMGGYEKEFGEELGPVVKGIFTDEPQIACTLGGHCRWTPLLFDTFSKMWGYDLRPCWPLLGDRYGEWKKVRHDYNATLLHLFIERWSKPWHEYTEKRGLKWTGHYWEHGWPSLNDGPDNMAMYAWHQQPAIDMLFNSYNNEDPRAQFGNIRSVKELRSVANQMGYVRTLSETYGGAGWDAGFTDFKRLGDWEYALGVNFMNQHLCHTTITGVRKYDYPPEFTAISPWWEDYGCLNDYFSRLSLVLSQGEQICDWLVLEPTTSLWLYGASALGSGEQETIGHKFQQFVTNIEKRQMEYDLGCEDIIMRHGSAGGGTLRVGCRSYHNVVIPPGTENLESSTFRLLKKFVRSGGKLYALQVPVMLDGRKSKELESFFDLENISKPESAEELVSTYENNCDLRFCNIESSQLFHQRRSYDDGELIFLVNSSLDDVARADFSIPCTRLYELDAMSGNILDCTITRTEDRSPAENNVDRSPADCNDKCISSSKGDRIVFSGDGMVTVSVNLPPAGSRLYFAAERPVLCAGSAIAPAEACGKVLPPSGEMRIRPVRENILNLDFCSLDVNGRKLGRHYVKEANGLMWREFGRPDPWESAIQFRRDILDSDTLSNGYVKLEYILQVDDASCTDDAHLIVERPDIWTVYLNGRKLEYSQDSLLDSRCGDFPTSGRLHRGQNSIVLECNPMSIHAEIAPVMVTGRFGVKNAARGFSLVTPEAKMKIGAWKDQLYPEYPWEVSYCRDYEIQDTHRRYELQLGSWKGTDAQVWVNGVKAGIVALPPFKMDLTPYMKEGTNRVEVRITGSLKNLYGPHYAPLDGLMGPGHWNGVREQRPGGDYDLLPYGLEEDFSISYIRE